MSNPIDAAVLFELGKPLRIISLTPPELKPGQVRVKIAYTSVCHTQLLEARGKRGPDRFLPHTLGHEASGTVTAVGPGVKKVKAGDRVVLSWIKGKGLDVPSTTYKSTEGAVNSGAISTFMRETITCENRLNPIPEKLPFKEAALLGCAVPTGSGIVRNTAKIQKGASVAVFGLGGIGMSVILATHLREPSVLIAVDIVPNKLERARELGATHVVDGKKSDPVVEILKITAGRGVDYAIEAAGKRITMENAFKAVRDKGGLCVLAGNLPQGEQISIDPFDLIKGKRIVGTWGGEAQPDEDIPEYIKMYLAGKLNLSALITHEFPFEKINEALDALERGEVGRAMVRMG